MNFDQLKKLQEAMSNDVTTSRLLPNYKDKTNQILERKCFIDNPIHL